MSPLLLRSLQHPIARNQTKPFLLLSLPLLSQEAKAAMTDHLLSHRHVLLGFATLAANRLFAVTGLEALSSVRLEVFFAFLFRSVRCLFLFPFCGTDVSISF